MAAINNDWLEALQGEFKKPYYKKSTRLSCSLTD